MTAYAYAYSRTSSNGWVFQPETPNSVTATTYLQWSPTVRSVVSTEYLDGFGRPVQTHVQDGTTYHITATQYDSMGRAWRTWKPYPRVGAGYDASFPTNATTFYNDYHSSSTAKPYVETSYTPDALGRVKRIRPEYLVTTPTDSVFHAYGLDVIANHQYTEVTDESGKKTRTFTDVFGNAVGTVLGYGTAEATNTVHAYNVLGQRTQTTDPRGLVTTYTFNTRGLLTAKTNPDAGTAGYKYDQAGNLRYSQDANQAAAGTVFFTTYDFAGRPLISGQAAATFSTLDPFTSQSFESTTGTWLVVRQYDAKPANVFPWSNFWTQISPLTLNNVAGRLSAVASTSNGAWQVTLFSYDTDGQVAKRYNYTQANGGTSVLTALNTADSLTRDLRGAITRRHVTVGSSPFYHWYDYDNRGLLWKVFASTTSTQPSSPDVTYTYRPSGQLQDRQFAGGPLVPLRYTIREHLEQIGDPAGTTYPFSARYAYHPNGTVAEAEFYSAGSPAAEKRYGYVFGLTSYDALNRLKSADFSAWNGSGWTTTLAHDLANIEYDAAGNLRTLQRYNQSGTLIDNLTYEYGDPNKNWLTGITEGQDGTGETWDAEDGAFTYDANGNMTTATGAPYAVTTPIVYDHQNLPLSLTSNGTTTAYRYNEAGQRITKQKGTGNTEVYLLDGASTLGVFTVDGAGAVVASYFNVLAGDKVVGRQPGTGNRGYYHTDLLGSTRAVVEGATVVESNDFDPWGLLMPGRTLAGPTKEGFTSKERDAESGLDYFGARYYMPALARFTAVDPLAEKHPEWSPYNYVLNDPLALIDPDGRQFAAVLTLSPEFNAGAASGMWSGIKGTAAGLWQSVRHPVQTARAVAHAVTHPGETLDALGAAVSARIDKVQSGDPFAIGEVFGEGLTIVGEALLGSKGVGSLARAGRVIENAGDLAQATRLGLDAAADVPRAPKLGSAGGPGAGKRFSRSVQEAERAESGNRCRLCGVQTIRSATPHPQRSNIDHAIPMSRGGNNTLLNAQNTCQTCNLKKGNRTTEEYLKDRQQ